MKKMGAVLLVILCSLIASSWSSCACGRGGLCLKYDSTSSPGIEAKPCHCSVVSKNIFVPMENHCDLLVGDHCRSKPCIHGECYNGFGTHFCKCRKLRVHSYAGHNCSSLIKIWHTAMLSQHVSMWFPMTGQTQWSPIFTLLFLSGGLIMRFEFEDGRVLEMKEDKCATVDYAIVIGSCMENDVGEDCFILQARQTGLTILKRCSVPLPFLKAHSVYVEGLKGPIGQYHDVKVSVLSKEPNVVVYLAADYRVFVESGPLNRLCPYQVTLRGCGETMETANQILPTSPTTFSAAATFNTAAGRCPVKSIKYEWSFFPVFRHSDNELVKVLQGPTITAVLYELGFKAEGLGVVQVDVTFQGLFDMEDESVHAVCFFELINPKFNVQVEESQLKYNCEATVAVNITPTLTSTNHPIQEFTFAWSCPAKLCGDNLNMSELSFDTNQACRVSYDIGLNVTHKPTRKQVHWNGRLLFNRTDQFEIKITCDPYCYDVNPNQPLILTASNTQNLEQNYEWFFDPKIPHRSKCDAHVPSNVFLIGPRMLKQNTTYNVSVRCSWGSKDFKITTGTGPKKLNCSFVHRVLTDIECRGESELAPITYWVFEGFLKELVTVSQTGFMKNVKLRYPLVSVEAVDSEGLTMSIEVTIKLNDGEKINVSDQISTTSKQINMLDSLLHEKDYSGMAIEIDSITKLDLDVFPFDWQYKLMVFLSSIQVCYWPECIIKVANSVKRLLEHKVWNPPDGSRGKVDEVILLAGSTVHMLTTSLYIVGNQLPKFSAYRMMREIEAIHDAARKVMVYVDPELYFPQMDEGLRRLNFRRVQVGHTYARKAIVGLGLFITRNSPYLAPPIMVLSVEYNEYVLTISNFPTYINCIEEQQESRSYFQFSPRMIEKLKLSGKNISVTVINHERDLFWWSDEKNPSENMIEILMFEKWGEHGNWTPVTDLNGRIRIYIKSVNETMETLEGAVFKPNSDVVKPSELDMYVNMYRIMKPRGHSRLLLNFSAEQIGKIDVSVDTSILPEYASSVKAVLNTSSIELHSHSNDQRSHVYVGVSANSNATEYHFNYSLIQCVTRSERMWKSETCVFGGYTTRRTAICICSHISLFGVILPLLESYPINLVDISLYTDGYYNLLAAVWVEMVLCNLILFLGVAVYLDQTNKIRKTTIVLDDNWPGDAYPYFVNVSMGHRCRAGTTSLVAVRLLGNKSSSHVHILRTSPKQVPLSSSQDCWFLLLTRRYLGEIEHVEIWLHKAGMNSDWYCNEIVVWDIKRGRRFSFPIQKWLIYSEQETSSLFHRSTSKKPPKWKDRMFRILGEKFCQNHNWASLFVLHPRSAYSRLDRFALLVVLVMVSLAASIAFYGSDSGPADRPEITLTIEDLAVSLWTILITAFVITFPTLLFSVGKHKMLKLFGTPSESNWKNIKHTLFFYPIAYLPVMLEEDYDEERWKWNKWTLSAHALCLFIIVVCIILVVLIGLNLGHNCTAIWVIVSTIAILGEALVVQPILILITSFFVATLATPSARNAVILVNNVEQAELVLELNQSKHLDRALVHRVKPVYKPPLLSNVRKSRAKEARKNLFSVTNAIAISLLILTLMLVNNFDKEFNYQKHHSADLLNEMTSTVGEYNSIRNRSRYFTYLRSNVIPAMHRITWYNGKSLYSTWNVTKLMNETRPTTLYGGWYLDYSTILIGVPQLRQQRLASEYEKPVARQFQNLFPRAYGDLGLLTEDTKSYRTKWRPMKKNEVYYRTYRYWSAEETKTGTLVGDSRSLLHGGGYVEHLHWSLGISKSFLVDLHLDQWLDHLTRSIFFSFTMFNIQDGTMSVAAIITERLASGVYRSRLMTEFISIDIKLFHRQKTAILAVCIAAVTTLHSYRTIVAMSKVGITEYFRHLSGFVDVSVIGTGYSVVLATLNLFIRFYDVFDRVQFARKDEFTPLYTEFSHHHITVVSVGFLSACVGIYSCIAVHNYIGSDTISYALGRAARLLFMFSVSNLFAIYSLFTFDIFGTNEIRDVLYTIFFKESSEVEVVSAVSFHKYAFVTAIVTILTKLNVALFVYFFTGAAVEDAPILPITRLFKSLKALVDVMGQLRFMDKVRDETTKPLARSRATTNVPGWQQSRAAHAHPSKSRHSRPSGQFRPSQHSRPSGQFRPSQHSRPTGQFRPSQHSRPTRTRNTDAFSRMNIDSDRSVHPKPEKEKSEIDIKSLFQQPERQEKQQKRTSPENQDESEFPFQL